MASTHDGAAGSVGQRGGESVPALFIGLPAFPPGSFPARVRAWFVPALFVPRAVAVKVKA